MPAENAVNHEDQDIKTVVEAGRPASTQAERSPASSHAASSSVAASMPQIQLSPTSRGLDHYLGQILDQKYRLEALLGKGGMGGVFRATHLGTGRPVAVKLILPEFMRTPELVERFKREARAAGRLRHPNIVDVTDFGIAQTTDEQIAYLVMEYLDGCNLSDILAEEGPLPLAWVVDVLEQICAAVHAAHQRGIVHRDLKPANIWLEPNTLGGYRVKVLDFGLAKFAGETELPAPKLPADSPPAANDIREQDSAAAKTSSASHDLTHAGAILGTPSYMAPEQCRGETADSRSDIYSLGVIAYQMLSGKTPFTGATGAIIRAHQHDQPKTLLEQGRKVPAAVSRLIMSALEKDPARRPVDAISFAQCFRAGADGLSAIYRRAFALYSEYFPQMFRLSLVAHIPVFLVLALNVALTAGLLPKKVGPLSVQVLIEILKTFAGFVTAAIIAGLVAILVTRLVIAPLRPVKLRVAFHVLRRRQREFFSTAVLASLLITAGFVVFLFPGIILTVRYSFWAPVVLLEGLTMRAALRRSRELADRSQLITATAVAFQYGVPRAIGWAIRKMVSMGPGANHAAAKIVSDLSDLNSILVLPLLSIVVAVVFLKLRQLGGQDLSQLMEPIAEGAPQTKWEQRMFAAETTHR